MTEQDLKQALNLTLTNYSKPLDENIAALWKGLFINFDARFFKTACLKVISSNKFFPNASEIIDAYQDVRQAAERERFDRLKESQRLLADGQVYCYLCDNSGFCVYIASNYNYVARCICSHGKDLNKFSESQIDREHTPEHREHYPERDKAAIKRGENPFYFPTISEALKEDFSVFNARRKEQYLSRKTVDNKQKVDILRKMGEVI